MWRTVLIERLWEPVYPSAAVSASFSPAEILSLRAEKTGLEAFYRLFRNPSGNWEEGLFKLSLLMVFERVWIYFKPLPAEAEHFLPPEAGGKCDLNMK